MNNFALSLEYVTKRTICEIVFNKLSKSPKRSAAIGTRDNVLFHAIIKVVVTIYGESEAHLQGSFPQVSLAL